MSDLFSYKNQDLYFGVIRLKDHVASDKGFDEVKPRYIYSKEVLKRRLQHYLRKVSASSGCRVSDVHYAVKSNPNPEILHFIKEQGLSVDVVSGGELKHALTCGFSAQQVVFSGVGKTKHEISYAIDQKIQRIHVESLPELIRIEEIASSKLLKNKVAVALRLNPDVDPKTHPYIATGFKENKFGISMSDLGQALDFIRQSKFLNLNALAMHIGSQLTDFAAFDQALAKLVEIRNNISSDFKIEKLDLGGGVGIAYQGQESDDEEILKRYCQVLSKYKEEINARVEFEPGRVFMARAGVLLAQVQYVKQSGDKKFIVLNSGMNHLIRPALYQAYHQIHVVHQREGDLQEYDIVGPVCESSDFFAKSRKLSPVEAGDWLCISEAGAYGASMASNYNLFGLPEEIFV